MSLGRNHVTFHLVPRMMRDDFLDPFFDDYTRSFETNFTNRENRIRIVFAKYFLLNKKKINDITDIGIVLCNIV